MFIFLFERLTRYLYVNTQQGVNICITLMSHSDGDFALGCAEISLGWFPNECYRWHAL